MPIDEQRIRCQSIWLQMSCLIAFRTVTHFVVSIGSWTPGPINRVTRLLEMHRVSAHRVIESCRVSNFVLILKRSLSQSKVEKQAELMAEESVVRDLELAFDVGHRSIGWAVLKRGGQASTTRMPEGGQMDVGMGNVPFDVQILGCGVVTFRVDSCQVSQRRNFRRQRRRIRAARLRIAWMEKLLLHLRVLSAECLQQKHQPAGGHSAPWFLAARVLASKGQEKCQLDWPELWDVLRWYAHNRGYDGNRFWYGKDFPEDKEQTQRERAATALMKKYSTDTMAETICRAVGLDPLGDKKSSHKQFKRLAVAFPRKTVEAEVRRLLDLHRSKLPVINDMFLKALFEDWRVAEIPGLRLPARYRGGLLFGQLAPHFQNRGNRDCPITGEKTPSKNCPESRRFRWAMMLRSIRVASELGNLRPLNIDERKIINLAMESGGALTPAELKSVVRQTTSCSRDNLDMLLTRRIAQGALAVDPVAKLVREKKLTALWKMFSPRLRKRVGDLWRRGKPVTLEIICNIAKKLDESLGSVEAEWKRVADADSTKGGNETRSQEPPAWMNRAFTLEKPTGRASYARRLLVRAHAEVLAGRDPVGEGGCLFLTGERLKDELQKGTDQQTENHLVRHRLLILQRLLGDLIAEPSYAHGDKTRVAKITFNVDQDLVALSAKSAKEIQQDLRRRSASHWAVAAKLEKDLEGKFFRRKPVRITPGLIRKARIAEDLDWTCPYTGKAYDAFDLVSGRVDQDHIIPASIRPADALDSLAVTFRGVIAMKGERSAWRFVSEEQGRMVQDSPALSIISLARYKQWTEKLESYRGAGEDKERKSKRKQWLMMREYEVKALPPRDLTTRSKLFHLGERIINQHFAEVKEPPQVVSLPGMVISCARRSWDLFGCLALALPQVKAPDGRLRIKTEIRGLTDLHQAVDACVLGLAGSLFPPNARFWALMTKVNPTQIERDELNCSSCFEVDATGRFGLKKLPEKLKMQISQRLAEKRVVQHISSDMSGLRVEENTRGITALSVDRVFLRQQFRDPVTGKSTLRETNEPVAKVIGLEPGKLEQQKGVRVIVENFGAAILDASGRDETEFVLIPWHKVWHRIHQLKSQNAGKTPQILRAGTLIHIREAGLLRDYRGVWMVRAVKFSHKHGVVLDMSLPEVKYKYISGRSDCLQNVLLQSLVDCGLKILKPSLTGIDCTRVADLPE